MKDIFSLKKRNAGKNGPNAYDANCNTDNPIDNAIEMELKSQKDIDLTHHEYVPGSGTAADNNELSEEIFEATQDAKDADESERTMPLVQALKTYPKAAAWSLLVSTTLIMEGYDTAILGSFYALPVFQKKFGSQVAGTDNWEISVS